MYFHDLMGGMIHIEPIKASVGALLVSEAPEQMDRLIEGSACTCRRDSSGISSSPNSLRGAGGGGAKGASMMSTRPKNKGGAG